MINAATQTCDRADAFRWRGRLRNFSSVLRSLFLLLPLALQAADQPAPVDYGRDVRPILSENCFFCHGQDANKRKAKLQLHTLAGQRTNDVVVPGQPDKSELFKRIFSTVEDEQMPPPDSHRALTAAQKDLLRRWIAEGATFGGHWAFTPPLRAPLPKVKDSTWSRSTTDRFVLARLEAEGLKPSPEARPETWLRRASFDLIGLAPTVVELDAFAAEVRTRGEKAYGAAADRLLASPRFGERLAQEWLDAARYADTHGFNNDSARTMWRWRDWVIEAFNTNLPYNQFLTEQLAGDLLPQPTLEQKIATGFGRNHVINSEGGIIDEEYRVEYVVDRVRTLGMATLGLSLECARCHDHKFDPITQRDYYGFFAFFNQVPEIGEDGRVANAVPFLPAPTREQQAQLLKLDRAIASESKTLTDLAKKDRRVSADSKLMARIKELNLVPSVAAPTGAVFALTSKINTNGHLALVNSIKPTGQPLVDGVTNVIAHAEFGTTLRFDGATDLKLPRREVDFAKPWTFSTWVRWEGGGATLFSTMNWQKPASSADYGQGTAVRLTSEGRLEADMAQRWPAYAIRTLTREALRSNEWHHVSVTCDAAAKATGFRLFIDGLEGATEVTQDGLTGAQNGSATLSMGADISPTPEQLRGELAGWNFYQRVLSPDVIRDWVEPTLARALISENSPARSDWLREWLLRKTNASFAQHWQERERLLAEHRALERDVPTTMIMADLVPPRPTHLLKRGQYDAPGELITAAVPETILGAWPKGAPRNRLGLARWLTQPQHPLTARVAVNRFWQQLFGTGLVKTSDDFGFQGEYPLHRELLDTLARDFADGGWDVKKLLRGLVLSATYRQDSAVSPALRERDPENRLLARGPRVRLPAETIRDHALATGGLLKHRLGGPSVFPVQPPDLFKLIVTEGKYPGTTWTDSTGDDLHRRSLYTFWKRTVPYPMLNVLDAPDREFCTVRRLRTNTPLQALGLMNEPSMVEAARHLGDRMRREGGSDDAARLTFGFRTTTGRRPQPKELAVLQNMLERFRTDFRADEAAAKLFLKTTASESNDADRAALAAVGSLLLNLDETITKN